MCVYSDTGDRAMVVRVRTDGGERKHKNFFTLVEPWHFTCVDLAVAPELRNRKNRHQNRLATILTHKGKQDTGTTAMGETIS